MATYISRSIHPGLYVGLLISIYTVFTPSASATSLVKPLRSVKVFEGGMATFTCQIKNRQDNHVIVWYIHNLSRSENFRIGGQKSRLMTESRLNGALTDVDNAMYFFTYNRLSDILEDYKVQVVNASLECRLTVNCSYYAESNKKESVALSNLANLNVFPRPVPRCSIEPTVLPARIPQAGLDITLTCVVSRNSGPELFLTWYIVDGVEILRNLSDTSTILYKLFPNDTGKEFICKTDTDSVLPPLTCAVIPIAPLVTLTPMLVLSNSTHVDVTFTCGPDGNRTKINDMRYRWFWNDIPLEDADIDHGLMMIVTNHDMHSSQLTVKGVLFKNAVVSCQMWAPSVTMVTSNSSPANLMLTGNSVDAKTVNSQGIHLPVTMYTLIIAISVGIALFAIGLGIGACFILKCTNRGHYRVKRNDLDSNVASRIEMTYEPITPSNETRQSSSVTKVNSNEYLSPADPNPHEYAYVTIGTNGVQDMNSVSTPSVGNSHPYQALNGEDVRQDQSNPISYTQIIKRGAYQQNEIGEPDYLIV